MQLATAVITVVVVHHENDVALTSQYCATRRLAIQPPCCAQLQNNIISYITTGVIAYIDWALSHLSHIHEGNIVNYCLLLSMVELMLLIAYLAPLFLQYKFFCKG